jgi:hypothetical protein
VWKRTIKKNRAIIEPQFFRPPGEDTMKMLGRAAVRYGDFLGQEIEIYEE